MRLSRIWLIATLCLLSLSAWAPLSAAQTVTPCTLTNSVPTMTIKIFNNSPTKGQGSVTIFPVLTAGANASLDQWMQGCFQTTQAQVGVNLYPRANPYRFYINPTKGIAPGQSVTVSLPLFSQLVPTPNATSTGQYIDWWQGGRIEIFASASALQAAYQSTAEQSDITSSVTVNNTSASTPQCVTTGPNAGGTCAIPKFFSVSAQFADNQPTQLTEWTLGARNPGNCTGASPPPSCIVWTLDTHNVDIDISYVDYAYLPSVMEPFNNPGNQTGWVGMDTDTSTFATSVQNWLNDVIAAYGASARDPSVKTSWTLVVDPSDSTKAINKIPSAQHILLTGNNANPPFPTYPNIYFPPQNIPTVNQNPPPTYVQNDPPPWPPIYKAQNGVLSQGSLISNWLLCMSNKTPNAQCQAMQAIHTMFVANYNNYINNWSNAVKAGKCVGSAPVLQFNEAIYPYPMIAYIYAWTPFNNGCLADYNQIYNTPGFSAQYPRLKQAFDELQLDGIEGPFGPLPIAGGNEFNPYVTLIHGSQYLNAPNVYAYSVDDAVGNLQSTADGFIIAVGGTANLPNPKPATKGIHVTFGPSTTVNGVTATFTQYGICTNNVTGPYVYDVSPTYQSFLIGSYDPASCPISLKDNFGRIYTAKLDTPPFYPKKTVLCPPPNPTNAYCPGPDNYNAVDCSGNTGAAIGWCKNSQGIGAYAYTDPNPLSGHRDKNSENYLVLSAPANPPSVSSPPPPLFHQREPGRGQDRN